MSHGTLYLWIKKSQNGTFVLLRDSRASCRVDDMEAKMPHEPCIRSDYLGEVFNPKKLKAFLKLAVPLVKKYDFQSFAFRGISGALIAPLLAHKTEKTLIVVRKPKPDESSHSGYPVEGDLNAQRYIIVDDFQ